MWKWHSSRLVLPSIVFARVVPVTVCDAEEFRECVRNKKLSIMNELEITLKAIPLHILVEILGGPARDFNLKNTLDKHYQKAEEEKKEELCEKELCKEIYKDMI